MALVLATLEQSEKQNFNSPAFATFEDELEEEIRHREQHRHAQQTSNVLAFIQEEDFYPTPNSSGSAEDSLLKHNTNGSSMEKQQSRNDWVAQLILRILRPSWIPFSSYCLTDTSEVDPFSKAIGRSTKSPYDRFYGSFPFVVTVLGPPKVGKTELTKSIKRTQIDIHHRNLFRFSSMPPDVQVAIKEIDTKEKKEKVTELGVYDSIGFQNAELIHYILEGQAINSNIGEDGFVTSDRNSITSTNTKPKRKVTSEGFIVMFDVNEIQSFEIARRFILYIFEYFNFDYVTADIESTSIAPVVVFLVGNKKDQFLSTNDDRTTRPITDRHVRTLLQSSLGKYVSYYETSSINDGGVFDVFHNMSKKIEAQRELYYKQHVEKKGESFWD